MFIFIIFYKNNILEFWSKPSLSHTDKQLVYKYINKPSKLTEQNLKKKKKNIKQLIALTTFGKLSRAFTLFSKHVLYMLNDMLLY